VITRAAADMDFAYRARARQPGDQLGGHAAAGDDREPAGRVRLIFPESGRANFRD